MRVVDSWMLSWGSSVSDGIGILPAPGSGWSDVIANGQRARLKRYVDAHVVAFGHARLLSWVPGEEEAEGRYRVGAAWAALRPLRQPEHFKNLRLLRALNLAATLPCLIAKLRWGVPFVVNIGADYASVARARGGRAWKWALLERVALRMADGVIVRNEHLRARLAPLCRVTAGLIPNWVDLRVFRPLALTRPLDILYVGRLVAEKNLTVLAEACQIAGVRLCCAGEGPKRAELEALGVQCLGSVSWSALPSFINRAKIFAMVSLTEGHCKALAEAMACGACCLVSTEVKEGMRSAVNCHVVLPTGPEQMAYEIRWLLDHPGLRASLGREARKTALGWAIKPVMEREIAVCLKVAR